MSRGDWSFLAALAGLAALFVAFGSGLYLASLNYPQEERYQSYRYSAEQPAKVEAATATKSHAQPLQYRTPCSQPEGRDESDLCAQWKAARAAERGALWTERGFWVGLGSILGLGVTIILTLKATQAAQRSAFAAEKAVEGSERPHLLLSWCKIDIKEPTLDGKYQVSFNFQNHGKGPCWVNEWGVVLRTQAATEPINTQAKVERAKASPWAIAPSATWHSIAPLEFFLAGCTNTQILSGEMKLLVFWAVRYTDSDGRIHDHNFALRLTDLETEPRLVPEDHSFFLYT